MSDGRRNRIAQVSLGLAVLLLAPASLAQTFSTGAYVNDYGAIDDGITALASSDGFPELAAAGSTAIAVWIASQPPGTPSTHERDIAFARSLDGGASWSPALMLSPTNLGDDLIPQIATDGAGTWVAAWYSNQNSAGTAGPDYDIYFARSTNDGVGWSAPALLNSNGIGDTGWDQGIQVAGSPNGTWVAVWRTHPGGPVAADPDLFFARSTDGGVSWSAPASLHAYAAGDSAFDDISGLATDGAGNWIAVWRTNFNLGGTGTDYDILSVRSIDDGATWSAPAVLNTDAFTDAGIDVSAEIETDGAGLWVTLWSSEEAGGSRVIHGARSTDAGQSWSAPVLVSEPPPIFAVEPDLAHESGRWLAIWKRGQAYFASSLDGGLTWSTPIQASLAPAGVGIPDHPKLAGVAGGRIVAVWEADDVPHPGGLEDDIFGAYALVPAVPSLSPVAAGALVALLLAAARRARKLARRG